MALLDLAFPVFTQRIIDDIIPEGKFKLFLVLCGFLLFLQVIRAVLSYIVNYWGHVFGIRVRYDMRNDIFSHFQKLSFSYFDNTKTGEVMSRIMGDLEILSELAHHGPEDLFIAGISILGAFILMLSMNVKLTLVVFTLVPMLIFFAIKQNRKMKKAFKNFRVKSAEMNAEIEDSIAGIRVVKAFGNEHHVKKRFKKYNQSVLDSVQDAYRVMGTLFSGIRFMSGSLQLVILFYGGLMIFRGEITLGILVGFFLFVNRFLEPVRKIMNLLEMYQSGMAGLDRFHNFMSIAPDIEDKKDAIHLRDMTGDVEFKEVDFSYDGSESVLEKLNLKIKSGEKLALVGPSGAGKSTVCSLIPRFYDVTSGCVTIDGIDVRNISQSSLRKNIGIVQQDVFLFNDTIRENIAFGNLVASDEEIIEAAKKANAYEFIMNLGNGFDTLVGERGVKLSGGQKQRISIARIFLKNPKILLLDEATSSLDNETERIIQNSLSELSKGRTTITIAHRLSTIKNSDRIVVVGKEGIVESGKHHDLISLEGVYAKLYMAQFDRFIPDVVG